MIFLKTPAAIEIFTFDWTDAVPAGVSISSVSHIVPTPCVLVDQQFAVGGDVSTVKVSGGLHGGLYVIQATATLSNGEVVPDSFTLRVFE
jgi:hypothetical protein